MPARVQRTRPPRSAPSRGTDSLPRPGGCQGSAHDLWQSFLFAPQGQWVEARA